MNQKVIERADETDELQLEKVMEPTRASNDYIAVLDDQGTLSFCGPESASTYRSLASANGWTVWPYNLDGYTYVTGDNPPPWRDNSNVKKVVFVDEISPRKLDYLFYKCKATEYNR